MVNLGTTTKLCLRNFVPKPHPGHVVVYVWPKIGYTKVRAIFICFLLLRTNNGEIGQCGSV